jgi:hypothetical protein
MTSVRLDILFARKLSTHSENGKDQFGFAVTAPFPMDYLPCHAGSIFFISSTVQILK